MAKKLSPKNPSPKKTPHKKTAASKSAKQPGRNSRIVDNTSVENIVSFTNLDTGETIPLIFAITGNYTNSTAQQLIVQPIISGLPNGVEGTFDPPSQVAPASTSSTFSLTLSIDTDGSYPNLQITVNLVDSSGVIYASDEADSIVCTDPTTAALTISQSYTADPQIGTPPALDSTQDVTGTGTPGDSIVVVVEQTAPTNQDFSAEALSTLARRGRYRRPIPIAGFTTVASNRTWTISKANLSGTRGGHHLRAIRYDSNGDVKGIVRGIYKK